MRQERWGGVEVYVAEHVDSHYGEERLAVVLLHGFGAPGDDLVPLWPLLKVPDSIPFVFPVGPLTLDVGYGGGRAWWLIDMERLARDQAMGRGRDVSEVPIGLSQSRERILSLLDDLEAKLNVKQKNVLLGGFSQGAMLACDVVLRTDRPFAGLVLMSGTLIAQEEWVSLMPNRKGLSVFQSHGTDDPLLPMGTAQKLRDDLRRGGMKVEWHEFTGAHEIPPNILHSLGSFIKKTEMFREIPQ